jgi:hypothetical protein
MKIKDRMIIRDIAI